jgi:hypothetical protein
LLKDFGKLDRQQETWREIKTETKEDGSKSEMEESLCRWWDKKSIRQRNLNKSAKTKV